MSDNISNVKLSEQEAEHIIHALSECYKNNINDYFYSKDGDNPRKEFIDSLPALANKINNNSHIYIQYYIDQLFNKE
jgi:hypothetical protein